MLPHASILAVGSELLAGQIVNGNAAWLSARLFANGIDTKAHLTVDDIEGEIVAGIATLAPAVDLLFVTGGLGPTSDDLTRNAVAEWAGQELSFHQPSWEHVQAQFSRLGAPVPESNKQQCYFPNGALVLSNDAGTANGFMLEAHGKQVWVLPGPPREVESIWDAHIAAAIASRMPMAQRKRLRMWRTIGKGESHLAEIVTSYLAGQDVEVAYRVHAPYVELKIRFPEAEATRYQKLCDDIEAALKPWLFETDKQNLVELLAERLSKYASVDIYDGVTQGHLAELLGPFLRSTEAVYKPISLVSSWEPHDAPRAFVEQALSFDPEAEVALAIAGLDASGGWAVGMRRGTVSHIEERPSFYKSPAQRPRNLKAIASLAVKAWHDMLSQGLN